MLNHLPRWILSSCMMLFAITMLLLTPKPALAASAQRLHPQCAECMTDSGYNFVHYATTANSSGNSTRLNNPLINGNPCAILMVTPQYVASSLIYAVDRYIGVWYDGYYWNIFHQDGSPPHFVEAFNVSIVSGTNVYTHTTTTGNIIGDWTTLSRTGADGNPSADIIITSNWNPCSGSGGYDNHSLGVWYDGSHWNIFHQDGSAMTAGLSYNVAILPSGPVHTATTANTTGSWTAMDDPAINGNSLVIIQVTQNWNPPGHFSHYNNAPVNVYYDFSTNRWSIFNVSTLSILNSSFNYVAYRAG